MLATVHQFMAERLAARDDRSDVARRHAEHFRTTAERADRSLRGVGQHEWAGRLEVESSNLAAAVDWYLAHDRTPLPHLFRVLCTFWLVRDHCGDARSWIEPLLPDADSLDPHEAAGLLWSDAVTAVEVGDDAAALEARRRLAPLLDEVDDGFLRAVAPLVLCWISPIADDFDGALRDGAASVDQLRRLDEPFWAALAVASLGFLETAVGRADDAEWHLLELRAVGDLFDNAWVAAGIRVALGLVAVTRGRLDNAAGLLDEALDFSLAARSTQSVTLCLGAFARLALAAGDYAQAALLAGAAEGLRRRTALHVWPSMRRAEQEMVAHAREALGADRFDDLFAAGTRLTQPEAVAAIRDRETNRSEG
jgi:hypothetical protein